MPAVVTIYGLCSIIAAITAYFVARQKQRNADAWAFVSFLVPPLFIVLLLLSKAKVPHAIRQEQKRQRSMLEMMSD